MRGLVEHDHKRAGQQRVLLVRVLEIDRVRLSAVQVRCG